MERTKRQRNNPVQHHNVNKKIKLENEITIITPNKSCFEDLANELIYEIFEYLDLYHVYEGFFSLNKRFQSFLLHSTLPIKINISTMSKSSFEGYYENIILPNKHRINLLRLSNPFTADIVLLPPRLISRFLRLETLIFDNISTKYLNKIFNHLMFLPRLQSLSINPADYVQYPCIFYSQIFRLPLLKYCKMTYKIKDDREPLSIDFSEYDCSPIEYLVINTRFPFVSFENLLFCLPQLRHLTIDCLVKSTCTITELRPIALLKHLKYVSLKLDVIYFNRFEKLIKNFFAHVEVLRISTKYDAEYLNAKRWEQLILSYMPNLRLFDINHDDIVSNNNQLTYHDLINQFNSSFWIERQWFFTHQHDWRERLDSGTFYSTDPYRREDYTFYWNIDKHKCSHLQETDLNSVKHVHIRSKQATANCDNYFPNATQLTLKQYFETSDDTIATTLNRIIPLTQLTKIVIESYDFPFEQVVKLLCSTPKLHTLKLDLISLRETNAKLIKQSESFQHVSKTNKIQNLILRDWCSIEKIQLITSLFPQLQSLKTGMNRKEIGHIIRYLLSKTNNKARHLLFLCISETPKICLKELNRLIKLENLLDDYMIKFANRDLYLWW